MINICVEIYYFNIDDIIKNINLFNKNIKNINDINNINNEITQQLINIINIIGPIDKLLYFNKYDSSFANLMQFLGNPYRELLENELFYRGLIAKKIEKITFYKTLIPKFKGLYQNKFNSIIKKTNNKIQKINNNYNNIKKYVEESIMFVDKIYQYIERRGLPDRFVGSDEYNKYTNVSYYTDTNSTTAVSKPLNIFNSTKFLNISYDIKSNSILLNIDKNNIYLQKNDYDKYILIDHKFEYNRFESNQRTIYAPKLNNIIYNENNIEKWEQFSNSNYIDVGSLRPFLYSKIPINKWLSKLSPSTNRWKNNIIGYHESNNNTITKYKPLIQEKNKSLNYTQWGETKSLDIYKWEDDNYNFRAFIDLTIAEYIDNIPYIKIKKPIDNLKIIDLDTSSTGHGDIINNIIQETKNMGKDYDILYNLLIKFNDIYKILNNTSLITNINNFNLNESDKIKNTITMLDNVKKIEKIISTNTSNNNSNNNNNTQLEDVKKLLSTYSFHLE